MQNLVVLSGAGMSAESGIPTFRDMGGIWEKYDLTTVASPDAWENNRELVLRFYNERRKKLFECHPNKGHKVVAQLEDYFNVTVVTQNVDDLHERAGSSNVLHLHGELKKARSTVDPSLIYELSSWELKTGDLCDKGSQLRPHIVWFGESVDNIYPAVDIIRSADILIVAGTSLNVYPAAGLIDFASFNTPVYVIDPGHPKVDKSSNITVIQKSVTEGFALLFDDLTGQNS
ncbi:Sir2 family NAD-dependent protein deacetylase [Marinilabiliaceae bacterium ANBcel2]|nr:Sir2 family NAD-dependent protein deacetylase [Marinilabiliaceae bacterium ANBcel2]